MKELVQDVFYDETNEENVYYIRDERGIPTSYFTSDEEIYNEFKISL